jgi:hypothetical protein
VAFASRAEGIPKEHFGLVFDWSSMEAPSKEDITPGDIQAAMHYQVMLLLRANGLFLMTKAEAERMRRDDLIAYYRLSNEKTAAVLAEAEAGDPIAFEILSDMLDQYHGNSDIQMSQVPDALRQFGKLQRYIVVKSITGPAAEKAACQQRDAELVRVIYSFIDKGYPPSRDKRGVRDRKPCGWWIVWRAAKRLGLNVSDRQIERRWEEALKAGVVEKTSRLKYRWAEQQSDLVSMLDGMELVSPFGMIIYPIESVSSDVIDHALRAAEWAEGLDSNDYKLTDVQREVQRDVTSALRYLARLMRRFEGYYKELDAIQKATSKLDIPSGRAVPAQLTVFTERAKAISAMYERELDDAEKEYPGLAVLRVSTIPRDRKQLGTAVAIECARLLQSNAAPRDSP